MKIKEIGSTGKFYVQADRQLLSGEDPNVWGKQIEKYINEVIRQEQDVAIPTDDGHVLLLTARSAYKLSDRHVSAIQKKVAAFLPDADFARKGRIATHIDELIRVARFSKYEPAINQKHENDIGEDGFNYFEAYFRDFDGKYYQVRFSAALNSHEETVYSIGVVRQRRLPADAGSSSRGEALKSGRKPSGDIIYTSSDKSQVIKSAIQLAYERVLANKGEDFPHGEQYRRRTDTLSNREVLERAYEVVDRQKLTEGQRYAMEVFHRHLDKLRDSNSSPEPMAFKELCSYITTPLPECRAMSLS